MLSIQHSLTGPAVPGILAPARNFIHEGKLMKVITEYHKYNVIDCTFRFVIVTKKGKSE